MNLNPLEHFTLHRQRLSSVIAFQAILPLVLVLELFLLPNHGGLKGAMWMILAGAVAALLLLGQGIYGVQRLTYDLAAREKSEQEHQRLAALMDATPDLVCNFTPEGKLVSLNRAGRRLLGIGPKESLEAAEITCFLSPEAKEILLHEAIPAACRQGQWQGEMTLACRDGREVATYQTVIAHPVLGDRPAFLSIIARDITDRCYYDALIRQQIDSVQEARTEMEMQQRDLAETNARLSQANARLEALATTDGLTYLKNHRAFQERLTEEISRARRYNMPLSVVLLDVDRFKRYNDTYGHPAGDEVLKLFAALLQSTVRATDFVARYGGEEFVLILPESGASAAIRAVERLRKAIDATMWPEMPMTASFGVATLDQQTLDGASLMGLADQALCHSKRSGRNCVVHAETLREIDRMGEEELAPGGSADTMSAAVRTTLVTAYDTTIEGWSHILDMRDKETEGHSERVTTMTIRLARSIGMSEDEILYIRWGALLHDIGKMGIPDKILLKPGPLTDEEWVVMRRHPAIAHEMMSPIAFLNPALDIPFCHHEKWDGTGYPRGLKGEEIPLSARLFAVVDVWDALRSDRPYRKGWPEHRVLAYLKEQESTHFDPRAVRAFLNLRSAELDCERASVPLAA